MAEFTQTYRDWSRGDWGDTGAFRAGQLGEGWFKAKNMVVYRDGAIGPRTGVKRLAHTGVPNGEIRTLGFIADTVGATPNVLMFVVGDKLYWVPAETSGAATLAGSLAGTETKFCSATPILSESKMFFLTRTQGVYEWDFGNTGTVTRVLEPPAGYGDLFDLALYRDRLYTGGIRRIFYSDNTDFTTWGALSFFDVGWQFANYRLCQLRNSLHFIRQGGGCEVLSGVPESTSTLRRLESSMPPDMHSPTQVVDRVYWIPQSRNAPTIYNAGIVDTESLRHLDDWTDAIDGDRAGAYSDQSRIMLFVGASDDRALVQKNGVWTQHTFGVSTSLAISRVGPARFIITDGGASGAPANFYLWTPDRDTPGFVGTSYLPGDNSDTPLDAWLHLPEWWHPRGVDVRVRAVEVDFTSWNTGTTETAHFDLTVRGMRPAATGTATASHVDAATQSFDEAVGSSSTTGTERRLRFNIGDAGWARGFQIRFSNIRSVSIRSVSVLVDDERRNNR